MSLSEALGAPDNGGPVPEHVQEVLTALKGLGARVVRGEQDGVDPEVREFFNRSPLNRGGGSKEIWTKGAPHQVQLAERLLLEHREGRHEERRNAMCPDCRSANYYSSKEKTSTPLEDGAEEHKARARQLIWESKSKNRRP